MFGKQKEFNKTLLLPDEYRQYPVFLKINSDATNIYSRKTNSGTYRNYPSRLTPALLNVISSVTISCDCAGDFRKK